MAETPQAHRPKRLSTGIYFKECEVFEVFGMPCGLKTDGIHLVDELLARMNIELGIDIARVGPGSIKRDG